MTVVGSVQDATPMGALLPIDAGISPNGKLLAYSTRGDLRLIDASTGAARVIFEGNVHTFTWGPRGDALGMTHDDPKTGTRDIYVLHLDADTGVPTGPAVKAALGGVNHGAFLSPDELLIAFAQPQWDNTRATWSERAALVVAPANGGPIRTLAAAQDLKISSWSPDGRTIYYKGFADASSKKRQIFRVPVAGGHPTLLRDATNDPWPNRVDPVTRRVTAVYAVPPNVSVTDWSGTNPLAGVRLTHPRGLRVINTADGATRDLIDLTAEVGVPEWFSNGNRLAIIARRNDKLVLLTLNADGTGERSYTFTVAPRFNGVGPDNAHLQVSPDGRFAAFLSAGRETIELLDLATGTQRTLVKVQADGSAPEGLGMGQLMWSDDSKSIRYMYGISVPERRAVHEVTLGGVDKPVLALPGSLYGQTAWFPANTVASPSRDAGIVELFDSKHLAIVPLSGGETRTVYRGQIRYSGPLSPDRRIMAIRDVNGQPAKEVTLVSLDDGSTRVITHPFIQVPGLAWHPDGQRLLIMGREVQDGPTSIYSVPIDGSAPRVIAPVGSNRNESVIAVSPDGKLIAVTVGGTPAATFFRLDYELTARVGAKKQ
jgi:Tol biopolymer transport system component